ncbi:MAG: tRNA uridine-5-carboxymethylaminomethyl(34) synthesis GTPase MnmE [bacterium]|nr:tRNA uridine-5-carboxymethylaminomethyl(34) synthesis GTPase MnmE [bacterium]
MNEAICAICTPYGSAAISIIRCSGDGCIDLVNNCFKGFNLNNALPNSIHYGHIIDNNEIIDEVMVAVFKAPKSFTAEDSVEINCHGGIYVTNRVLRTLLRNGFRMAEPGEFSKRAFLNGRIDLVQAESIMDMVSAKNKLALGIANNGISKKTSNMITNLKQEVLDILVDIEVNIDYPEYTDIPEIEYSNLNNRISKIINKMDDILDKSSGGKLIREGIKTVIVGKPNVGKSSLLNTLLDEEKAIVSDIEGTTRDYIEGFLNIGGITLNLIDTAGIRTSIDEVEQIGVKRSLSKIDEADLVLVLLDNSRKLNDLDLEILEKTKNKKRIIIMNKIDLNKQNDYNADIYMSINDNKGIDALEDKILEILNLNDFNVTDSNYLSNVRHIDLLEKAKDSLVEAIKGINNMMEVDMISIDIKNSLDYLGEIVGESNTELVIDRLFQRFCLGK